MSSVGALASAAVAAPIALELRAGVPYFLDFSGSLAIHPWQVFPPQSLGEWGGEDFDPKRDRLLV